MKKNRSFFACLLAAALLVSFFPVNMEIKAANESDMYESQADGDRAPVLLEEDVSGRETVSFSKNGIGGNPYTSGLNNPMGYYFKLDESKRLLSINVNEFATYNTNVNRGTFRLYQWRGSYADTVASDPLYAMDIVDHVDHDDLTMTLPQDAVISGELYFEIICTEGAAYTPWFAEGGVADEQPGKVTGMQAYLGGNPNYAFACEITLADIENRSPFKFVTWTYDFGDDLTDSAGAYAVTHTNQINIGKAHGGYTTFTAAGEDPYFRIPDEKSPAPKGSELGYVAILYRTTAPIAAGEFFVNHGGAIWGQEGTFASVKYQNDGVWHVALCDASASWGKSDDTLSAFRFDPLASGCASGDSIDVAWLKFFGDGDMARSFADDANKQLDAMRQKEQQAGTVAVDFGTGKLPAGFTADQAVTVFVQPDFIRLMSTGEGTVLLDGLSLDAAFGYARLICRTENLDSVTLSVGDTSAVSPVNDNGFWQTIDIDLTRSDGADSLSLTLPGEEGWLDIACVVLCSQEAYRDAYQYPRTLNTHRYVLGESSVPVLTCTVAEAGDPYCGPGEFFGQKFESSTPVSGVVVYNMSTWSSSDKNAGIFRLWAWQGSYDATVSGQPLVSRELTDIPNNVDFTVTFDPLEPGAYLYEIKMTSDGGNAYTGFYSKGGEATEGSVAFRNGQANGMTLYSAYLTPGRGLVDKGPEYAMTPTVVFDFTSYIENASTAYGLKDASGCTVTDLCDKGYVTFTSTGNDPFLTLGSFPQTAGALCDWIVIKYRANTKAPHGEFFVCRTDGVTWGQDYARSNVLFDWENDGAWHIAVIDASGVWGQAEDVEIFNVRFDPMEKPEGAGESVDVSYIRFFASETAARTFADSEYVDGAVPAPEVPVNPADAKPVLLLDGEKLTVTSGSDTEPAAYNYEQGYVTLTAKGSKPSLTLLDEKTNVARYMAVRYRTTVSGMKGTVYAGSVQSAPHGGGDCLSFDYIPDGAWHTAVLDLGALADYDTASQAINYLQYDYLTPISGAVLAGDSVDIAYIGFFAIKGEAECFIHTPPNPVTTHTIRYLVDGRVIYTVTYREGDTAVEDPVVPQKPGMVGKWETYTLSGDIDVNAVYTPDGTQAGGGTVVLPEPGAETETDTDASPETAVQDPQLDTAQGTEPATPGRGCHSALLSGMAVVLLAVCALGIRKRRM